MTAQHSYSGKELGFWLSEVRREAQQLATCTGCYGSGADRLDEGRACSTCAGRGKAPREPHVVELVDLVRQLDAEVEELSRARYVEQLRAEAERNELREQVRQLHDDRRRLVAASVLGQQAGERAVAEEDELRRELDDARGDLYQARHAEQRSRQQGFDAGCELMRERVLALVVDGRTPAELRRELAQAVRGES
jgi:hypothetical protein